MSLKEMALPIYIIKTTKAYSKSDVCTILLDILGPDAIDRFLSIDALGEKRVFIIAFWRVPLVNQFHNEYIAPGDILHGKTLPWVLEQLDPYGIFRDGHFPAPHFLRNTKNLTDVELDELGIGGPGEFVYVQLPTNDYEFHWEMYRDGTYYMPDMTYYNKAHLEPLSVVGSPRWTSAPRPTPPPRYENFNRWRDFYLEHPETWPKDLTPDERAFLEEDFARLPPPKSPWRPECGRDPTNLAEEQIRLEVPRLYDQYTRELTLDDLPKPGLTRAISVADPDTSLPTREGDWSAYPAHERLFITDEFKLTTAKYKWNYRSFD